jgi:hypothetical protein
MRALTLVLLLALAAPAAAKPIPPLPPLPPRATPAPSIRDGSAQRKLDRARERWHRAGIHSYRFRVRLRACCSRVRPQVLFVRDDRAVKAPAGWRSVATVKRLQQLVQKQIDAGVASLSVHYDRRGIPVRIAVDPIARLSDDEFVYRVDRFWRGTRGRGGPSMP